MFKLNLKIALRNLWKYKGYTAINILGLSIGLASCILIFIFVNYQMSFDKGYAHADRIFRVVSTWKYADGNEDQSQGVPRPLAAAMRNDFSQLEKVAAVQSSNGIIKVKAQEGKPELKSAEVVFFIEPSFFDIFDYKWRSGQPHQALSEPFSVVLSEKMAANYFGSWKKAIGKSIVFENAATYKVTGIVADPPANTTFPFHIIFSYASYSNKNSKSWSSVSSSSECYVLLKKGISVQDLNQPLQQFIRKYYVEKGTSKEGHQFQALNEIHHSEDFGNFAGKTAPYKQLIGLSIIGLFLLITACINFINLATAQAISRSKEVGVKKVMGSRRQQLVKQFLSETGLLTFIALLIACVISELALPAMSGLFGGDVTFSLFERPFIFVFLFVLLITVSFLAGFYPALVMSNFSPALAIKNKMSSVNAGGIALRRTLVVMQFAITAVLIVSTMIVVKQMNYVRNKPIGYDSKAVALLDLPADSLSILKFDRFKSRLLSQTGIKSVSFCSAAPSSDSNNETNFKFNSSETAPFQVNTKIADQDYFKTFGLQLVAGKVLSQSDTIKEFIVNETLLKKLNVRNPNEAIGKIMSVAGRKAPVVGVVRDFNNYSLHEQIAPIAIFSLKKRCNTLAIKVEQKELVATMKEIERTFNAAFPDYVYSVNFLDEQIDNYYNTEKIMGVLFRVFAGVVIFISFIGLFGLISFVATQRTKEIAIRKVLGASNLELVQMLNRSFLWMVAIANLIAWPVAYILVSKWLNTFEYRIHLNVWPFVLAMLISMAITLITVTLRSFRAARANTIDALKYE